MAYKKMSPVNRFIHSIGCSAGTAESFNEAKITFIFANQSITSAVAEYLKEQEEKIKKQHPKGASFALAPDLAKNTISCSISLKEEATSATAKAASEHNNKLCSLCDQLLDTILTKIRAKHPKFRIIDPQTQTMCENNPISHDEEASIKLKLHLSQPPIKENPRSKPDDKHPPKLPIEEPRPTTMAFAARTAAGSAKTPSANKMMR